ncbi:MAG: multicopper oxidase domain-containing protein [Deltaproteobacteria bacterium]|nr:multicopper oxidase domain-containing protein [Deltaproteobacteria bacterium]
MSLRYSDYEGRTYPVGPGNEPTEIVKYGTAEIWSVINLSADTHPMHFHLFDVRAFLFGSGQ